MSTQPNQDLDTLVDIILEPNGDNKTVMRKGNLVRNVIDVPIFKAKIHYLNGSWSEVIEWLSEVYKPGYSVYEYGKKVELAYSKGTTGRVFVATDNTAMNVTYWFWSGEEVGDDTGYCGWLAHECMHLVTEIMRQVETPLTAETEEIYAHLLEYIVTQILNIDWGHQAEPKPQSEATHNRGSTRVW